MSGTNRRNAVAYGLSEALPVVFNPPIISNRAPLPKDKAPLGTIWIDKPNNDGFVLTSVVANVATWIGIGGGSGSFTDITVTGTITAGGSITTTAGDITADTGTISATAGNVSGAGLIATTNNIVAVANDIRAIAGDIFTDPGQGDINSGSDITAAQNITATSGDITASAGDILATLGNIEALAGDVVGQSIFAAGDSGGVASTTGLTNVIDNVQGAGTLSILSSSANPGNNTGFLKVYVGATTAFIPYFTNIAP